MDKKWIVVFYTVANLIFISVIIDQWIRLREMPDVIRNYSEYRKKEYLQINKYILQCFFYMLGWGLSLIVLGSFFMEKEIKKKLLFGYGLYFLLFIILELPLYDKHYGWSKQHGHSYWYGFHFH